MLDFFTRLVQRVAPKHYFQAAQEVIVTRRFFENFSGDNVRASETELNEQFSLRKRTARVIITASCSVLAMVLTPAQTLLCAGGHVRGACYRSSGEPRSGWG